MATVRRRTKKTAAGTRAASFQDGDVLSYALHFKPGADAPCEAVVETWRGRTPFRSVVKADACDLTTTEIELLCKVRDKLQGAVK